MDSKLSQLRLRMVTVADECGNLLVDAFHYLALFAIGGAIAWSAGFAFFGMASKGHASIDDILLLFIYLELGAMVGIYFKTNHMPVRFLLYVGMTAMTHQIIATVLLHKSLSLDLLLSAAAMLILALATLCIRYGSSRFPVVREQLAGSSIDR